MPLTRTPSASSVPRPLTAALALPLPFHRFSGSNVFNILLGLGLPWWIKAAADGDAYPVPDFAVVGEPLIILLIYVVLFMAVVIVGGWQLSRRVGISLLACQAMYTVWTMLRNFPVGAPVIAF